MKTLLLILLFSSCSFLQGPKFSETPESKEWKEEAILLMGETFCVAKNTPHEKCKEVKKIAPPKYSYRRERAKCLAGSLKLKPLFVEKHLEKCSSKLEKVKNSYVQKFQARYKYADPIEVEKIIQQTPKGNELSKIEDFYIQSHNETIFRRIEKRKSELQELADEREDSLF